MSRLKEIRLYGTCDGTGAATINATRPVFGRLYAVLYIHNTLADTSDVTITCQNYEVAKTLLTLTDQSADAWYYPRDLVHDAAGAALTGTSGGDRTMPLMAGVPRAVIAQGGSGGIGGVVLYYLED